MHTDDSTETRLAANVRRYAAQQAAEDKALADHRAAMASKALTVGCPTCGAAPGSRCSTAGPRSRTERLFGTHTPRPTATHRPRYRLANRAKLKG